MTNSITLRRVSVNDSKSVISDNKARFYKDIANSAKPLGWSKSYDSIELFGKGGQILDVLLGDEVNDLMAKEVTSDFLTERYNLQNGSTIQDLYDKIPVFAEVRVAIDVETPDGEFLSLSASFCKNWEEGKGLSGADCRASLPTGSWAEKR